MKKRLFAVILLGTMIPAFGAVTSVVKPWKVDKVKMTVQQGDKTKEIKVVFQYQEDRMEIYSVEDGRGTLLTTLPYEGIQGADYSFSKHRRWKSGAVAAAAAGVFAAPVFFTKGKKHWLTIRAEEDTVLLRLDKGTHETVRAEFTSRTGVPVGMFGFPAKMRSPELASKSQPRNGDRSAVKETLSQSR